MISNDDEKPLINKEKTQKSKQKISLILTGGTIGAKRDLIDNVISEVTERYLYNTILNDLIKNEIDCDLYLSKSNVYKLSENMVPSDWEIIAKGIVSEIEKGADGVVVTHGTDTLAYTTSAISFMIGPVPIPIVFTGAFYPLNEDHSDALKNIRNSILFSLNSIMPGIFVLFSNQKNNGYVFRGAQITSVLPYGMSFSNPNFRPLASFESNPFKINYISKYTQILSARNFKDLKYDIDPNVVQFKVYPGFNPKMIDMALRIGAKGIVLELYHSSTACTLTRSGYSLIEKIIKCKKNGIPIYGYPGVSTCEDIYRTTRELQEAGLCMLKKMTPESAVVKLMWLIANYPNEIETKMKENISYEIFE